MEDIQNERNAVLVEIKKIDVDVAFLKKILDNKYNLLSGMNKKLVGLNMKLVKSKYNISLKVVRDNYIKLVSNYALEWPYGKEAIGHPILIPIHKHGGGLTHMIDPDNYNKCIPDQKTWDVFAIFGHHIMLSTVAMKFNDVGDFDKLQETFDISSTSILAK